MHVTAIVVGTGFGGAVTACRLSQAGMKPLVLERGRRYEASDFPALPPEDGFLPDTRRLGWEPEQGLVDVQDLGELVSVQAAGYGGGSLLYANVVLRAPAPIFEQEVRIEGGTSKRRKVSRRVWPQAYTRDKLDPYYDLVGFMLDAAPITKHPEGTRLVKADQLRRAASKLGRKNDFFYPPLAVSRAHGPNAHGKPQSACVHCGSCCMGCPHGAKNTLDHNYLYVAEENGATVRTECEVLEIARTPRGYRVYFIDHVTAHRESVECDALFLCAGAVHTTRLLAAAELGVARDQKPKSRVGFGYWPNADAIGVVFDTVNAHYPSYGPTITSATVFADRPPADPERGWFMIQDGGYAKELERMIGLLRSPLWAGRNRYPKPLEPDPELLVEASLGGPKSMTAALAAPPLRSPFDGVLDALETGAFDRAVPEQLVAVAPELRKALARWLLPKIVEDTVNRRAHERVDWVRRWFGMPAYRFAVRVLKWFVRAFGSSEAMARNAQDALMGFAGMSRNEIAERVFGYEDAGAERRAMLLAMGPDSTPGRLHYEAGRVLADLDLFHLAPRYLGEELAMRDIAAALGGELRVNPAWSFLGKPITVHSQGGCRMSDDAEHGVLDPNGQVWRCPGLFVFDGSSLCSSVGANPSATIAAIAERNVLAFIRQRLGNPDWPTGDASAGARQYRSHKTRATEWASGSKSDGWALEPRAPGPAPFRAEPVGLAFDEVMQGFHADPSLVKDYSETNDATHRRLEVLGRPTHPLELHLTPRVEDFARFLEDHEHALTVEGSVHARLPGGDELRTYEVKRGTIKLFLARTKRYALSNLRAQKAQSEIAGNYTSVPPDAGAKREMTYELDFEDQRGVAWSVLGYKHIRDDPGLDAWRDTSTLFVRLVSDGRIRSAGAVHIDFTGFMAQLRSMRIVSGKEPLKDPDPARVAWTLFSFAQFFFGNLQRIYLPELGVALDTLFRPPGTRRER